MRVTETSANIYGVLDFTDNLMCILTQSSQHIWEGCYRYHTHSTDEGNSGRYPQGPRFKMACWLYYDGGRQQHNRCSTSSVSTLFLKGPGGNYFRRWGHTICGQGSTQQHENVHRWYMNEWMWLGSSKTLFMDVEIWISSNFQVPRNNIFILILKNDLKV